MSIVISSVDLVPKTRPTGHSDGGVFIRRGTRENARVDPDFHRLMVGGQGARNDLPNTSEDLIQVTDHAGRKMLQCVSDFRHNQLAHGNTGVVHSGGAV